MCAHTHTHTESGISNYSLALAQHGRGSAYELNFYTAMLLPQFVPQKRKFEHTKSPKGVRVYTTENHVGT